MNLMREIAEVLAVDPVVRVEVRDDDLPRIEAKTRQLLVEPAAAVRHRARLADHHSGLERIEDVEEVAELRPEELTQLGHVLAALEIRLAGDDRDHPHVFGIVRLGERFDRLVELLVRLGVGGNERHMPELVRIRQLLVQGHDSLEAALLLDQPVELPPAASRRELVARRVELGDPHSHGRE